MSLTIPRRIELRRGDYRATCQTCGFVWMRSDMRRDADGLLRCPDDDDGEATIALMQGNAEAAAGPTTGMPYGEDW